MSKSKVETGKVVLTENSNLRGQIRFSVHLSHENYPDSITEGTEIFSGQELFDDLASHYREELRTFIQKRSASIMERRRRHRRTSVVFTKKHLETVHPTR